MITRIFHATKYVINKKIICMFRGFKFRFKANIVRRCQHLQLFENNCILPYVLYTFICVIVVFRFQIIDKNDCNRKTISRGMIDVIPFIRTFLSKFYCASSVY